MYSTTNRMQVNRVKSTSLCLKFVTTVSTEASVFSVIVVFCDAVHLPCSNLHWHFVTDSLVNVASCVSFFLLFSNITLKYCHLPGNEQCWIGPFPTPQNINNNKKNTDCKKKKKTGLFVHIPSSYLVKSSSLRSRSWWKSTRAQWSSNHVIIIQ